MISSLRDIPSISKALTTSKLLGIYFASSWCPDCTPTTPMVHSLLQHVATTPQQQMQIVYISSDNTKSELEGMVSSLKPEEASSSSSTFTYIPFDNEEERSNVKRLFGACAGKESGKLGLIGGKRKFGIPTLAIINCETLNVITMNGLDDLLETNTNNNAAAVEKWLNSI